MTEATRSQKRLIWLAGTAALAWLALALPALVHFGGLFDNSYRFYESWVLGRPRLSADSARVDGLSYLAAMGVLLAVWLAALWLVNRAAPDARLRRLAFAAGCLFAALNLAQVPFTSTDPFYYRGVGLVVASGENPFVAPVERVVPYTQPPARGRMHPPLWGPLTLWMHGASMALAGPDMLAGIAWLKLPVVLFHLLNLWLVGRIAREIAPGRETWALVLYGWCPLFVFEHAGIGHNDPPMLTAMLLSAWLAHRGRIAAAGVAIAVGVAFKLPAALAGPALVIYALLRHGRAAWGALLGGGLASAALLAALYAPFWAGADTFAGVLGFGRAYFASVPQLLRLALGLPAFSPNPDPAAFRVAFEVLWLAVFVGGLGLLTRALARRRPHLGGADYAEAVVAVAMLFLVTQQTYFWSWYVTWALALAGIASPRSPVVHVALALAVGAVLGSSVYRFIPPFVAFTAPPQIWAATLSFGPALLVAVASCWRKRGAPGDEAEA